MDPFHQSIGTFNRFGKMMTEKEVAEQRTKQGKCPKCGTQLYSVFVVRKVPLNVPGEVQNGRCLRCEGAGGVTSSQRKLGMVFRKKKRSNRRSHDSTSNSVLEQSISENSNNNSDGSMAQFQSTSFDSSILSSFASACAQEEDPRREDPQDFFARLSINSRESDEDLGRFVRDSVTQTDERLRTLASAPTQSSLASRLNSDQNSTGEGLVCSAVNSELEEVRMRPITGSYPEEKQQSSKWELTRQNATHLAISAHAAIHEEDETAESVHEDVSQEEDTQSSADDMSFLLRRLEQCENFSDIRVIVDMMKDHPSSSSMFCRYIRNLSSKEDDVTSAFEISSWITVIVNKMWDHPNDEDVQIEACSALWSIASRSDETKAAIGYCIGAIEAIIKVIARFETNSKVIQWAFGALSSLALCNKNKNILLREGGERVMVDAVAKNSDEVEMQENLCGNILVMIRDSHDIQVAVRAAGLVSVIIQIMKAHVPKASTQRWCLVLLWNLTDTIQECSEEYIEDCDHILDSLSTCMKTHPYIYSVQELSCVVLANILNLVHYNAWIVRVDSIAEVTSKALSNGMGTPSVREYGWTAVFNLGDAVVEKMTSCSNDASTQEEGCRALVSISRRINILELIGDRVLVAVIRALENHWSVASVQECALGALVLFCRTGAVAEKIASVDAFPSLVKEILDQPNFPNGHEKMCFLLSKLSVISTGRSAIARAEGVDGLMKTMKRNMSNCNVQKYLLLILRNLASSKETDMVVSAEKTLPCIIQAMQSHPNDEELQEEACGVLWSIFACDETKLTAIKMHEAIQYVVNAMKKHLDCYILQEEACSVLWHCAGEEKYSVAIANADGVESIIGAMARHRTQELHERGCCVFSVMSSHDFLIKSRIIEAGGIDILISSMLDFPESRKLQLGACCSLQHLAVDSEALLSIGSHGGFQVLTKTIEGFSEVTAIRENVCGVLFRLISETQFCNLTSTETVRFLVKEMKAHPNSLKVQESGLAALLNICLKDDDAKGNVARFGGIEVITRGMRDHLRSPHLQQQACVALWSLAVTEENRHSILQAGGIYAILNSMLAHIADDFVQEKACGALMTLATDAEERGIIRAVDGAKVINHAMRANYYSAKVQKRACSVFANLAVSSKPNEVIQLDAEELAAIIIAMRIHPDTVELHESACLALWNYSIYQCNEQLLRSSPSLRHVLTMSAKRFPSHCGERVHELLDILHA